MLTDCLATHPLSILTDPTHTSSTRLRNAAGELPRAGFPGTTAIAGLGLEISPAFRAAALDALARHDRALADLQDLAHRLLDAANAADAARRR